MRQRDHKKCHEALGQLLSGLQTKLSEWAAGKTTSLEKCVGQQEAATVGGKASTGLTDGLRKDPLYVV